MKSVRASVLFDGDGEYRTTVMAIQFKPRVFEFKTGLRATSAHEGVFHVEGKGEYPCSCPSIFCGGRDDLLTPEDLFVEAVESCAVMTFLWLAERRKLTILSYESEAKATVTTVGGVFRFREVAIEARIVVPDRATADRVRKIVEHVEKECLVTRSVVCDVTFEADIRVNAPDDESQPIVSPKRARP